MKSFSAGGELIPVNIFPFQHLPFLTHACKMSIVLLDGNGFLRFFSFPPDFFCPAVLLKIPRHAKHREHRIDRHLLRQSPSSAATDSPLSITMNNSASLFLSMPTGMLNAENFQGRRMDESITINDDVMLQFRQTGCAVVNHILHIDPVGDKK